MKSQRRSAIGVIGGRNCREGRVLTDSEAVLVRKVVTAGDKKELSLFQERDEFAAKLYELLDLHWGD